MIDIRLAPKGQGRPELQINLLPYEQRRPELPLDRIFAVTLSTILVILVGIYGYTCYAVWSVNNQISVVNNQYQLLIPIQEKMESTNAKLNIINSKNGILTNLTSERTSWYAVFTQLGIVSMPQIWLTEVSMVDKEKTTLRLKGMALTYMDLADYLQKFDSNPLFVQPALLGAERDPVSAAMKFEITVKIRGRS